MLITNYYKLKKGKGRTRFDEVVSTGDYPPFEILRNKNHDLTLHLHKVQSYKDNVVLIDLPFYDLAKDSLVGMERPMISSFQGEDSYLSFLGFGMYCEDAILLTLDRFSNEMEIFIIKGYADHCHTFYIFLKEGRLLMEIESIRKRGRAC
jgi:hypothetical protein